MPFSFYYGGYWTIVYILFAVAALFAVWAQLRVNSSFSKYSKVASSSGRTGAQTAEMVLAANGVRGVAIGHVSGKLTDHYDPRTKMINLSDPVGDTASVAAMGIAAHEAGHAVQDYKKYPLLRFRSAIVKTTGVASNLAMPLILAGLVLSAFSGGEIGYLLANIGVVAFSAIAFFQLVTLPVEFNASRRAVKALDESGVMDDSELRGVKKVLTAAALTYVAALTVALVNLFRVFLMVNGNRRNRR